MGDLHHVSLNRIAGTGSKIDNALRDLDIEALKVQDNGASCQDQISDITGVIDGSGLDDTYFHT